MTTHRDCFEYDGRCYEVIMDHDLVTVAIDHQAGIFDGVVRGADTLMDRPETLDDYEVTYFSEHEDAGTLGFCHTTCLAISHHQHT